jgi:hypothetical protein
MQQQDWILNEESEGWASPFSHGMWALETETLTRVSPCGAAIP